MKTMTKLAVATLLGMTLFTSTASADVAKGQKFYLKKLKARCGFSGTKFAHKHTQDQWESIYESGKFSREVKKICPKARFKKKYAPDLFDFVYKYASDSGIVPTC